MQKTNLAMTLAALAVSALAAAPAQAHIDMVGPLKARDGNQKDVPCDGARGDAPIYTFEPGATITLSVEETIAHPSYYRIAFDNDGQDFKEPKSIKPIDPARKCPTGPNDKCGESDFCTPPDEGGAVVLWDNLNPHLASKSTSPTWTIKLPDVECDNCTIQVLQIMEDDAFHGPYCPVGSCKETSGFVQDIYHRCIDIKLVKGAAAGPGIATSPAKNEGMECSAKVAPPTTGSDAGVSTPSDAGASTADAGVGAKDAGTTKPAAKDAGSSKPTTEPSDEDADEASDDDSTASSSTKDAGKATKKDAGKPSSDGADEDSEESDPPAKVDDGGCSVTSSSKDSSSGAVWSLLALGALLVRRKRAR